MERQNFRLKVESVTSHLEMVENIACEDQLCVASLTAHDHVPYMLFIRMSAIYLQYT